MALFRTVFRKLTPSWLSTGEGELVNYSLGAVIDAVAQRLYDGMHMRFPSHAGADALALLSRDRKLVRGINETPEHFAARLPGWLDKHIVRGNPFALIEQLREYCGEIRIRTVDVRGNWYEIDDLGVRTATLDSNTWDWDGRASSPRWASFWVIIYPQGATDPWAVTARTIGDPLLWGGALGRYDGLGNDKTTRETVGATAEPEHVARIRAIIRDWQPDGTRCEWVILSFNSASFDPSLGTTQPTPNPGTWGTWGKLSGADYVSARSATHRYWRGAQGAAYT